MENLLKLITLGPLAGYRTYVLAWLTFFTVLVNYLVGDITLASFVDQLPALVTPLLAVTIRARIDNSV